MEIEPCAASLRSLGAQLENKVLGVGIASVADTVFFVRSYVGDRAGAETRALATDSHLQRAFTNQENLHMGVTMRRVGHCARRQVAFMQRDTEAFVRLALQHRPKCVLLGGMDWKAFEAVDLRRQHRGVRAPS